MEESLPDMVIHLGDGLKDVEDLMSLFPQIPFHYVPGNCDGFTNVPPIKLIEVENQRILLSHGHLWSVKRDMVQAYAQANAEKATILLHGHTHIPKIEEEASFLVMNPGPSPASYGIITLEEGTLRCELRPSQT